MIIKLPLSNDPSQKFVTQLGSVKYLFNVRWNDRASVWVMDVTDNATQTVIKQGLPIVLGCDLLQPYVLGIGHLMVVDDNGTGVDATSDDLGTRVNLYWVSPDEVLPQ